MRTSNLKKDNKRKEFDKILLFLQICVTLFCAILIIYLFCNQIVDVRHYKEKGRSQRSMKNYIMRGSIVDRNGIKLANDKGTYTIYIHPGNYKEDPDKPQRMAEKIAPIINIPASQIKEKINSAVKKQSIVLLKRGVDREIVKKMRELHIREISYEPIKERIYPQGTMAAHVL